jgi:hypothetical protein
VSNRSGPVPPENVQVILADGRRVPVECVYDGFRAGRHRWVAPWPVALLDGIARLHIDMLPARTVVSIAVIPEGGGDAGPQ